MIPDKAMEVLTAAQLRVVVGIEGAEEGGVCGLLYDVMTGGLEVMGKRGRWVVAPDGLRVDLPGWMSLQQGMQLARRWRAMQEETDRLSGRSQT